YILKVIFDKWYNLPLQEEACYKAILIAIKFKGVEFVKLLISRVNLDDPNKDEANKAKIQQFLKDHQMTL
ncbi:MAG: hypothetical protein ACRDFB_07270, partial [Rhabdochlamydiaceae bacterium]